MRFEIAHLHEYPEYRTEVARWIHEEWWSDKPGHSVATMTTRLEEANDRNRIPLSLVALHSGGPIGTVNLVSNDNDERPDLTPWLAALLVLPQYRMNGVGATLVQSLVGEAERLRVSQLYLGTDIPEYYARLGAEMYEELSPEYCIMCLKTGV